MERDLTASSSLGNGIESSATAAINCSEPVEDSKALPHFAAEEGSSKKRKAGTHDLECEWSKLPIWTFYKAA